MSRVLLPSSADCKRALLVPPAVGLVLLIAVFVGAETWLEGESVEAAREKTIAAVNQAFEVAIRRDSDKLGAALKVIARDDSMRAAFVRGDRAALQAETGELFAELRRDHDITHFYFIDKDRRMFLRVQRPESYGDLVERTTLLRAEQTAQTAKGLELGQKGVFTLRVVEPWRDRAGALVGYIELGIEIDRTLVQLHELTGADLFLLVDKRHLDRRQWEEGMDMIGHAKNWDLLPSHVAAGRTRNAGDELLLAHPHARSAGGNFDVRHRVKVRGRPVEFVSLPLLDAAGRNVGTVLLAHDLTTMEEHSRDFFMIVAIVAALAGITIFAGGSRFVDATYRRLTGARPADDVAAAVERAGSENR